MFHSLMFDGTRRRGDVSPPGAPSRNTANWAWSASAPHPKPPKPITTAPWKYWTGKPVNHPVICSHRHPSKPCLCSGPCSWSASACPFLPGAARSKFLRGQTLPQIGGTHFRPVASKFSGRPAEAGRWSVEVKQPAEQTGEPALLRRFPFAPPSSLPAPLPLPRGGLDPNIAFQYRLRRNGNLVFEASGKAIRSGNQPYRYVVFGISARHP